MKKNSLIFIITIILFCINNLFAEIKINAEADAIIKKMEVAAKIEKLKSIKNICYKMKIEVPNANISGEMETVVTKNKSYVKTSMAGQIQEAGFNGTIAWGKDLIQGIRELTGQEKENCIQTTIDVISDYKKYFDEIQLGKDDKFNEKDCHTLICKKNGLPEKTLFIDKNTFVVVGAQEDQDSPQGKMNIKTYFDSYKTTSQGFTIPEKITIDMSIMKMHATLTEIEVDKTIDEKLFEKPAK